MSRPRHEDERPRLRDEAQMLCAMVRNLGGVDFSGRDLNGLVLRNKILVEADLSDSDLRRAVLTRTNFTGADLRRAKSHAGSSSTHGLASPAG